MPTDITDILTGAKGVEGINRNKRYGLVVAVVTDNNDPDKLYRVKVRYPWDQKGGTNDTQSSYWARMATFGAGKDRGMFNLPEVDDEVVVAFEHGEIQHPIIIGSLWNSKQSVFLDSDAGKNHKRTYKSRSGHIMEYNDEKGKCTVTIKTQAGHIFKLDDTDGALKCYLYDKDEVNKMLFDTTKKELHLETQGKMFIYSKDEMSIKTDAKLKIESKDDTTMDNQNFTMTAKSNFTIKASGGTGDIESSGTMTIKGSTVNIN